MDSTHATVGVAGISGMAALTTLLTGWHGLDGDHASAAAWLICAGFGGAGALISWFIKWKWPTVPPLPER